MKPRYAYRNVLWIAASVWVSVLSSAGAGNALDGPINSPNENENWTAEGAQRLSRFYLSDGPRQNSKKAFEWGLFAAKQGEREAQFNVGSMYYSGNGVATNRPKSLEWFRKAGKQGHARAQSNAGNMLFSEQGVATNYAEAAEWFRLAALENHPQAQQNLSAMLAAGMGIPQDLPEAYKWLLLADQNGIPELAEAKKWVEAQLSPEQLASARRLVAAFYPSRTSLTDDRSVAVLPFELTLGKSDVLYVNASDFFTAERIHAVNGASFISSEGIGYACRVLDLPAHALDLSIDQTKRLSALLNAQMVISGKARRQGREWKCSLRIIDGAPTNSLRDVVLTATNLFDLREKTFASILIATGARKNEQQAGPFGCETCRSDSEVEPLIRGYTDFRKSDSFSSLEKAGRLALKQNPNCVEASICLATALAAQGKKSESKSTLMSVVASHPNLAKAYQGLGVLAINAQEFTRAESLLIRSQLFDPNDPNTLTILAQLYQIEGDLRSAFFYLEEARSVDRFLCEAYAMLATVIFKFDGNLTMARRAATEAERLLRGTAGEEEMLGAAYEAMGDIPRAVEHYKKYSSLAKKSGRVDNSASSVDQRVNDLTATLKPCDVAAPTVQGYTAEKLLSLWLRNCRPRR